MSLTIIGDQVLLDKINRRARKSFFIFIVFAAYLLFGALLFQGLEFNERERELKKSVQDLELERAQLLEVLWAETITKDEEEWSQIANDKLDIYEKEMTKAALRGIDMDRSDSHDNPWTLLGSFYYAYTIVTTIGYGNMYPTTELGKLVTVVYGTVGIPLALLYLTEIGRLLTLLLKVLLRHNWPLHFDRSEQFNVSAAIAVYATSISLLLGAVLFYLLEDISLIDSVYFVFVTVSTVGLGDVTPSLDYLLIIEIAYSLVSLSLCSMCFVQLQLSFEYHLNKLEQYWTHVVSGKESTKEERVGRDKKLDGDIVEEGEEDYDPDDDDDDE